MSEICAPNEETLPSIYVEIIRSQGPTFVELLCLQILFIVLNLEGQNYEGYVCHYGLSNEPSRMGCGYRGRYKLLTDTDRSIRRFVCAYV